jgi:hypothetical protein
MLFQQLSDSSSPDVRLDPLKLKYAIEDAKTCDVNYLVGTRRQPHV